MPDLTANNYYRYRQDIRDLYKNDTTHIGDLCSNILQVRDKNKCVSSIKVAIQDYCVNLEFDDTATEDKKMKVMKNIANSIGRYIVDNKGSIHVKDTDEFDKFLESDNHLFCDIVMVGNSLKFNL